MLKNPWPALVAIPIVLLTLSCTRPDHSSTKIGSQNKNVLRIDVPAPVSSLDPTVNGEGGSTHVYPLLYSFLFVPNHDGKLEPDLAARWDYDSDGFAWTIHLRDGALFHNGRRVTTRDVEYSLMHACQSSGFSAASLIDRITHCKDATLRINLKVDDPDFPMKIWDTSIVPDPGGGAAHDDDQPIGSGPFQFKYRGDEREVGLAAYDRYYGGRPSLDGVVFYYQPDAEKSWARLLAGKTDIVLRFYPKDSTTISMYHNRFYFYAKILDYYTILLYNTADPLFADPDIRLALTCAVDRESIIDRVLHGAGTPASGPAGVSSPHHNPELKPVPYDPERAVELLRQAGWAYNANDHLLYREGRCFEFTILIFEGNQIDRMVAESLQLFLNDVGIKTHLQSVPQDELMRRYVHNNEFQAVLTEFGVYPRIAEGMWRLWAEANGQKAAAGMFDHPQVNRLVDEAFRGGAPARSIKLYQELDALIASLQPGMFLFHKTMFGAMSKRMRFPLPFSIDTAGTHHFWHASVAPP